MARHIYLGEVIPNFIEPVSDSSISFSDIVKFGTNNLFPIEMAALARQSAYLRGVINSKVTYCAGTNFEGEDVDELHASFKNLLLDDFMTGNAYIELVTDRQASFLKLYHQDTTKVRIARKFKGFILNPDWENRNEEFDINIPEFPKFKKGKDGLLHSMLHIKNYEPGFKYYGIPDNYSGMKAAIIDSQADRWNKERLENSYSSDGILIIPGVDTTEEAQKIQDDLNRKKGAKNAGTIMPIYQKTLSQGESKEKPEFIPLTAKDDGSWLKVDEKSGEKILIANGWYASLAAFPQNTGFDTQRILNDYYMAKANVIEPIQKFWLNVFNTIFKQFNMPEVTIVNSVPLDDIEVMTIDERRAMLGKDPIDGGNQLLKGGQYDN